MVEGCYPHTQYFNFNRYLRRLTPQLHIVLLIIFQILNQQQLNNQGTFERVSPHDFEAQALWIEEPGGHNQRKNNAGTIEF